MQPKQQKKHPEKVFPPPFFLAPPRGFYFWRVFKVKKTTTTQKTVGPGESLKSIIFSLFFFLQKYEPTRGRPPGKPPSRDRGNASPHPPHPGLTTLDLGGAGARHHPPPHHRPPPQQRFFFSFAALDSYFIFGPSFSLFEAQAPPGRPPPPSPQTDRRISAPGGPNDVFVPPPTPPPSQKNYLP